MRSVVGLLCAVALASCHVVSGLTEFELGEGGGGAAGSAQGGAGQGGTGQGGTGPGGGGASAGGNGAAGGELLWATSFAGVEPDRGRALATGSDGTLLVTGSFFATLDLDPGSQPLASAGDSMDTALLALDPITGALLAAARFGGAGDEEPQSIARGPDGSTYLCGTYHAPFDFGMDSAPDPDGGTTLAGYLVKYGPGGDEQWLRTFVGMAGQDARCHGVAADASGVYVAGHFTENLIWAGQNQMESGQCGFVAKLDANGDPVTVVTQDAVSGNVTIHGLALSGEGRVVIVGELGGDIMGSGYTLDHLGNGQDLFVVQLDESLVPTWQHVIGGDGEQHGEWVASNGQGDVVVAAIYSGVLPVLGNDHAAVGGALDTAVIRYDAAGVAQWIRPFQGTGDDRVRSVHLDGAGDTFVALGFAEEVAFAGLTENAEMTDVMVARLDPGGDVVWHVELGGPNFDTPWGITERDGRVIATGQYFEPMSIDGTALKPGAEGNWWVAALAR